MMRRTIYAFFLIFPWMFAAPCFLFDMSAHALSRIKDLAAIEGVRENQLVGYGLVVGLNGTGDKLNNSPFTRQSLTAMLERLGVNTRGAQLKTANVAAVMVTADLPAFAAQGTRVDVTVSALGDAKSLDGGTLLVTPLMGADGEVYAVAQGSAAIAGFLAEGDAARVTQGVPTVGHITNGALIEREIKFEIGERDTLRLSLHNPDFTTAKRVETTINNFIGVQVASIINPATIRLKLPESQRDDVITLLTDIEQLRVEPDQRARVIINERSGVIVMGKNVRISTVAIAQGNLTISVRESPEVSQPNPLSLGQTAIVPRTEIDVKEQDTNGLAIVNEGVTLQEFVTGLNRLGVGTRDMISILQAIKSAGALQADVEVM